MSLVPNFRLLISLLTIIAVVQTSYADNDAKPLTAGWLKQGCSVLTSTQKGSITSQQEKTSVTVAVYMIGFMHGANAMALEDKEINRFYHLPDDWINPMKLAPALIAFIDKYSIPKDSEAREVMMSYYYLNHPDRNEHHESVGYVIISRITGQNHPKNTDGD